MNRHNLHGEPDMEAMMLPGMRVVRGIDWNALYGNQDGTPPGAGSVIGPVPYNPGWFKVKWDAGGVNDYRVGADGKYELMLDEEGTLTNNRLANISSNENNSCGAVGGWPSQDMALKDSIVENVLECSLCIDTYKEPRSLPCQHSFCKECLQSDINENAQNGIYRCPNCRRHCKIGANGAETFPRNFALDRLLDIISFCSGRKRQCDVCRQDGKDEMAMFRCMDCSEMLCPSCKNIHRRFKMSSDHTVLSLADIQQGKCTDTIRGLHLEPCPEHKSLSNYHCKDCQRLICIDCIIVGKCKHVDGRKTVEEARELTKTEIEKLCESFQDKTKSRNSEIEKATRIYAQTASSLENYRRDVNDYAESLNQGVEAARKQHMERIEEQFTLCLQETGEYIKNIQEDKQRLQTTVQQCEKLLNIASLSEMMTYKLCLECCNYTENNHEPTVCHSLDANFIPNHHPQADGMTDLFIPIGFVNCLEQLWSYRYTDGVPVNRGICILPQNSDVIIFDRLNRQLVQLNRNGQLRATFHEDIGYPWDCATTNEGNVMVRKADRSIIQILGWSEDDGWRHVGEFSAGINALGLATTRDNYAVITSFEPPAVRIVTQEGNLVLEVQNEIGKECLLKDPRYAATNSKDQIIFTDWRLNTVAIINNDGELAHRYAPGDESALNQPHGVCTDDEDYIYVCDKGNDRILQLYPGGQFCRELIAADVGLKKPMVIAYDKQTMRLVVGEHDGAVKAFRYKL